MNEPIKESPVSHQLLIAGTILFLVAFFSLIFPGPSSGSNSRDSDPLIIQGMSMIAGYLGFVVLIVGGRLLTQQSEQRPPDGE